MLVRILITTRMRLNYTQDMTELWVNSVTYERSDFPSGFCCYDSLCHRRVGSNISVVILPTVHAAKSEIYLKQSAYDFNVPVEDAKHIKCVMHWRVSVWISMVCVETVRAEAIHCTLCTVTEIRCFWGVYHPAFHLLETIGGDVQTAQLQHVRSETSSQSVFLCFSSLRFHLWFLMSDLGWPACYCSVCVGMCVRLEPHKQNLCPV